MVQRKDFNWPAWLSIFLTLIAFTVGAVVWANTVHSDLRIWTGEQDYANKKEIEEEMKEKYVPLHEFAKVQQQLKDQTKQLDKLDKKLDKVLERLHE